MTELLPAWPLLSAFLVASLLLAVTPGPGVLCIVTCSLVQGRRAGLAAGAFARFLRNEAIRQNGRRISGGMFVGLGLFAALSGSRGQA